MCIKKYIPYFLSLLLFQVATSSLAAQNEQLKQAIDAYSKNDFATASQLYENVLQTSGESAEIYYNIGNCNFKMNKIAPAILNYEKALLLNPGDGDIRFNLEFANTQIVDKIEPIDEFFVNSWIKSLQNLYSTNTWSYIGIASFLLLITCLVFFFFSRKIILKKIGFYIGIFGIVLTIASNCFAYNQKQKLLNRNTAIVFAPTVTIKSSPDMSGNDLFILHEGTKVTIKSQLGEWAEIQIADGNIGWIKSADIEVI